LNQAAEKIFKTTLQKTEEKIQDTVDKGIDKLSKKAEGYFNKKKGQKYIP
jgi:hypothetical protein